MTIKMITIVDLSRLFVFCIHSTMYYFLGENFSYSNVERARVHDLRDNYCAIVFLLLLATTTFLHINHGRLVSKKTNIIAHNN